MMNRNRFLPAALLVGLLASTAFVGGPAFAASGAAALHPATVQGAATQAAGQQADAKPTKTYCRKHPTDPRCRTQGQ